MRRWSVIAVTVLGLPALITAQTIVGSRHDLSDPAGTNEPCVFCHTPHGASSTLAAPLWNRGAATGIVFTPYSSGTMDTTCLATPNPASLACLSCHDGVLAPLGDGVNDDKHGLLNAPGPGGAPDTTSYANCERCHPEMYGTGPAVRWLGTDMRNDHPISMPYPTAAQDPAFNVPPDVARGWTLSSNDVKLFSGRVECSSCHNVHNPSIRPFLRKSNARDALCLTCHIK